MTPEEEAELEQRKANLDKAADEHLEKGTDQALESVTIKEVLT